MLLLFRAGHSGVSNPSLCPSFRGFGGLKPLSWEYFISSFACDGFEDVRL